MWNPYLPSPLPTVTLPPHGPQIHPLSCFGGDPPPTPALLSETASWHCGSHPHFCGSRSPSRRTSSWRICSSWRWGHGHGLCHHTLGSPSPSPPRTGSPRIGRPPKTPSPTSWLLAPGGRKNASSQSGVKKIKIHLRCLTLSLRQIGVKQGELGTKSAFFPHPLEKSRSDSDTLPLKKSYTWFCWRRKGE